MADDHPKALADLKVGDRLNFNIQKSPQYRTIHCDGAYGGLTSRSYISFSLFNERNVLPKVISREVLKVTEDGAATLGPETIDESLGGIMRQVEASVFMDINTAREFYLWFGDKLADLEEATDFPADQRVGKKKDAQR